MLVSIITPSFNQAAYLEQTIQSVLGQDYPHLEYIIVDGGSTDGSVSIIEKYASQLAWWVSEPDQGQADAINKGLAHVRGEIVAWLNSDDLYLPEAVSAAVEALQAGPSLGMVYGDMRAIDGMGKTVNLLTYGDWGLDELMRFEIIGQPAVFLRRTALEQAGLLDVNYYCLLDHHLWLRVAALFPIQHISQLWAAARFHPEAKNVAQAARFGGEAYCIVEWMRSHPLLATRYSMYRRRIWAGAHRINARYLLDGGLPRPALRSYLRSLLAYPPIALREAHRMAFAAASLFINVGWVKEKYLYNRQRRLEREKPSSLNESSPR